MKHRWVLFIFVFVLLWDSCTENLTPEKNESKLVLFGLIESDRNIIASVSKSISSLEYNLGLSIVDSISVILYENDILIDTLIRIDSLTFVSKIKPKAGYYYSFKAIDLTGMFHTVESEKVLLLEKPVIHNIKLDSIGINRGQSVTKLLFDFDTIKNLKYVTYGITVYERGQKPKLNRWNTEPGYLCEEDELASVGTTELAYVGCFEYINNFSFISYNFPYSNIDSIKIELCKIPDETGEFFKVSKLVGGGITGAILAPDDNLPSNIKDGYGQVVSISCADTVFVIKK